MRIGILTFHRAYNYGAVLQCYALQQYLLSQGHDVEVIDYQQPWIDACFTPLSMTILRHNLNHPRGMYTYITSYPRRKKELEVRKKFFTAFRNNYLKISNRPFITKEEMPQDYDAYIIGSDQLWGVLCLGGKFDDVYLGDFPHNSGSKIIGYAISSDIKSIEQLAEKGKLSHALKCFSAVSFREKNISDKVYSITGETNPVTVDPTLLTDAHQWKTMIDDRWKKQKYVAIYQVRGMSKYKDILYEKAIKIMALMDDECKIIDLSDMQYSVTDFVSIIKYAKFVITTSFHATVFSIIFKTPFYAVKLNDGRDNRYVDLCAALGISRQCIETDEKNLTTTVNFSQVDNRLQKISQQSKLYINNNLL